MLSFRLLGRIVPSPATLAEAIAIPPSVLPVPIPAMAQELCSCGSIFSPIRNSSRRARLARVHVARPCAARATANRDEKFYQGPAHQISVFKSAAAGLLMSASVLLAPPALADLNQAEANIGGEFGIGSSKQYGEADV